jgi:putative tricarboxylic transport membrane protein
MRMTGFPFLPAVLGVVLGPLVESNYRRSLQLSGGDHSIFLEDNITIGLLVTAFLFIVFALVREWRDGRKAKSAEKAT